MSEPLLNVTGLTMRFGGLVAVDGVNLSADTGRITALIGPNGAGKTTIFNCLTGFYKPTSGELSLAHPTRGKVSLQTLPGYQVARHGVVRTFQNIRLFPRMTVLENLLVAQHVGLMQKSVLGIAGLLGLKGWRTAQKEAIERARFWINRLDLAAVANEEAGNLSYGMQRRVEIARAMNTDPLLLCLDEPAAGLNPRETAALGELLQGIRAEFGIGILLIEHDMTLVMGISDHIHVVEYGRKIAEGTPAQIRTDERVIKAYLGEPDEEELPPVVAADIADVAGEGDRV
ncbi:MULTISPECIES: high-affinity branched-chain amino acid ABC transporter ATP-binding protein LivG [unclassified Azospirillum]|uniref:high-affinity branched-chain amino acid ABC transporter ATP-binding protein LivG n=1 Tax=unclassified Azospirillum TaxID=2630922 RepID=UPI000B643B98|nr:MULTISPECIES: high-affinity branched-chain amino acid ABC transporter ATP-binding protein LivG [unclassified Azospirillum]SNS24608.1 branched-chain amino acid transport system ATP-binding protein [Azospirillum sp. RU38E]SNS43049.1 branched-chain amino acid transport system ATP-binding protein [Azospirillum sp. RU37A]